MSTNDFVRHSAELRRAVANHKYELTPGGMFLPGLNAYAGTTLNITHMREGEVLANVSGPNVLPLAARNYMVDVICHGVAAPVSWYVALFTGNVTPGDTLTAATFPAVCTELTAYDEVTRPAWVEVSAANGATDNGASRALFTLNATVSIYGGGLFSSNVKGSTNPADNMLGAARTPAVKNGAAGDELLAKFSFSLTSA